MSQGDFKPNINQQEKEQMLDELESLSKMLDDEFDDDEPERPVPEGVPVLKSFVDNVPVLDDALNDDPISDSTDTANPVQQLDSLDQSAANFTITPTSNNGKLDMSFLDRDPLDLTAHKSVDQPPTDHTAQSITQPLNRFQSKVSGENPFLPKTTLDKIRQNREWEPAKSDASEQLHRLLKDNPLHKLSFDANSKEHQALRKKASEMINDVIRANMPRLEAELRMKLEQEVDRMLKEAKKK